MPLDFNKYPYRDDFTDDNLYYRLLFQPGRAVQARELTQIQSLLQDQIAKLGSSMFKDGSLVAGGAISYDRSQTHWLAVKPQDAYGKRTRMYDIAPGMLIRSTTEAVGVEGIGSPVGKIVSAISQENQDPDTIYFKWHNNAPSDPLPGFGAEENLIIIDANSEQQKYTVTTLELATDGSQRHYGTTSTLSVEPGVYFWKGMFVKTIGGSITLEKYNKNATYRIGYSITEEVIENDSKSYDPSEETSNYSAPGADRYRIEMTLIKLGDGSSISEEVVSNFMETARVVNGRLVTAPPDQTINNMFADQLAKSNFETHGNYMIRPYGLEGAIKNKTTPDNPKMVAKLNQGISYVGGYRHSLNKGHIIELDKARDVITEDVSARNKYGDNFLFLYDEAPARGTSAAGSHPDNANGFFVVGSGAGEYTSNATYGNRGAAVSIHCVPIQTVRDHSLAGPDAWNSTLVGTARPMQMLYNRVATIEANKNNRDGDVYQLWLGDFKSSPMTNTVAASNQLKNVSAYSNATFSVLHFASETSGWTANDRVSVTGANPSTGWHTLQNYEVHSSSNATAILVSTADFNGKTAITDGSLNIQRHTGNSSYLTTVVLDESSSAALNASYEGATIVVGNNSPREIVHYSGTDSRTITLHNEIYRSARGATVWVDREFDEAPKYGDKYTINLTMKNARSVVYNYNKSATGEEQYPAKLATAWNVDPVNGINPIKDLDDREKQLLLQTDRDPDSQKDKMYHEVWGNRAGGHTTFNSGDGFDSLLFNPKRSAMRSTVVYGDLDAGKTSNTTVYYLEQSLKTCTSTSTELIFSVPIASNYKTFDRPLPFPYETDAAITHEVIIKGNFTLINRVTGEPLVRKITNVNTHIGNMTITITLTENFVVGDEYSLLFPVKASFAKPAYKKLVIANTTHTITKENNGNITDYSRGQVVIANGSYSTGAGSRISLGTPDGFKLKRVLYEVGNGIANSQLDVTTYDVTDRFNFDTGQRDMFYDNCGLVIKDDVNAPSGNLFVMFDYFQRMDKPKTDTSRVKTLSSPGFFSVDSYQWTTDVVFGDMIGTFSVGDRLVANSGVSGYVLEFANTGSGNFATVRLQDVTGLDYLSGNTSVFTIGEWISKGSNAGKIKSVTYADMRYSEIPKYSNRKEQTVHLRNVFDFRPYVSTNNMVSDTISDSFMPPIPTHRGVRVGRWHHDYSSHPTVMQTPSTVEAFVPRVDKIMIDHSGNYQQIKGVPSNNPVPPRDPAATEGMTIFTIQIPAYTAHPKLVQVKRSMAVRHTMKDIGRLAKRVENLEYYVSLNALEKATAETTVLASDGTERFKNGIVVDDFTGFGVIDHSKDRQKVAIGKGFLRPLQETPTPGNLQFRPNAFNGTTEVDPEDDRSIVMLDYTTTPAITQPYATGTESVNPFDVQNYVGTLKLTPDHDEWFDNSKVPEQDVTISAGNESILIDDDTNADEVWNKIKGIDDFWNIMSGNVSLGEDIEGTAAVHVQTEDGSFELNSLSKDISLGSLGHTGMSKVLDQIQAAINQHGLLDGVSKDMKILPYIRSRDIIVDMKALRPNYNASLYFEGIRVDRFFGAATKIYMKMPRYRAGETGSGSTTGGQEFMPMISDPELQNGVVPGSPHTYERIQLTSPSSGFLKTANAVLLAVRDLHWIDQNTKDYDIMVGYVVPEFDEETGTVDWTTKKDGFYSSSWTNQEIRDFGMQGRDGRRTITGWSSGTVAELIGSSEAAPLHHFNGHRTGALQNTTANTTHMILSPDAHRYINENFGLDSANVLRATGKETLITIVKGPGYGQSGIANGIVAYENGCPVVELRYDTGKNTTGFNPSKPFGTWRSWKTYSDPSIYTITMVPIDTTQTENAGQVNQIGRTKDKTNDYGEKYGVFHLPSGPWFIKKPEWTAGNKTVTVTNHGSNLPWLSDSTASAIYFAQGTQVDRVSSTGNRLEVLKELRTKLNGFEIDDFPMNSSEQVYVPARNNDTNMDGKLAVVTKIILQNGTYVGDSTFGVPYVAGAVYGENTEVTSDQMGDPNTGTNKMVSDVDPASAAKNLPEQT